MNDRLSTGTGASTPQKEDPPEADDDDPIEVLIAAEKWHELGGRLESQIREATQLALSRGGSRDGALSILLADDAAVQQLNRTWRGKNMPTNVLSFPADTLATKTGMLGDIALARETILREAQAQQKPPLHHMLHLVVHGTLHLLGYDHELEQDAEVMESLEQEILAELGVPNPYRSEGKGD